MKNLKLDLLIRIIHVIFLLTDSVDLNLQMEKEKLNDPSAQPFSQRDYETTHTVSEAQLKSKEIFNDRNAARIYDKMTTTLAFQNMPFILAYSQWDQVTTHPDLIKELLDNTCSTREPRSETFGTTEQH
jgi:hypothetical protein